MPTAAGLAGVTDLLSHDRVSDTFSDDIECSGETGWRLSPPWRPKTYIYTAATQRPAVFDGDRLTSVSEQVMCGRRLEIAGRRRVTCSWFEWTRGCETDEWTLLCMRALGGLALGTGVRKKRVIFCGGQMSCEIRSSSDGYMYVWSFASADSNASGVKKFSAAAGENHTSEASCIRSLPSALEAECRRVDKDDTVMRIKCVIAPMLRSSGSGLQCPRRATLLASHQGDPGSITNRATGCSHVGIVPDNTVGRRVFLGISHFPAISFWCRSILTLITTIGSHDLAVKSRPNLFIDPCISNKLLRGSNEPQELRVSTLCTKGLLIALLYAHLLCGAVFAWQAGRWAASSRAHHIWSAGVTHSTGTSAFLPVGKLSSPRYVRGRRHEHCYQQSTCVEEFVGGCSEETGHGSHVGTVKNKGKNYLTNVSTQPVAVEHRIEAQTPDVRSDAQHLVRRHVLARRRKTASQLSVQGHVEAMRQGLPEKVRWPVASFRKIPTYKNPGVSRWRTKTCSPWWEASRLTAQPLRPLVGSISTGCTGESYRTIQLVGGFSPGSPVPPHFHSRAALYSFQSPSSALKALLSLRCCPRFVSSDEADIATASRREVANMTDFMQPMVFPRLCGTSPHAAHVQNVCSVVVTPLESRRATSCVYNSSHPVWHALYECLQYIHGDSSPFLLQPFHELSNGFWPRLTSPHSAIQFVPKRLRSGLWAGQSNRRALLSAYHCIRDGAAVAERLARYLCTKANRVRSRTGSPTFAKGNGRLRWSDESSSGSSGRSIFTSITLSSALKTSLLRIAQISSLRFIVNSFYNGRSRTAPVSCKDVAGCWGATGQLRSSNFTTGRHNPADDANAVQWPGKLLGVVFQATTAARSRVPCPSRSIGYQAGKRLVNSWHAPGTIAGPEMAPLTSYTLPIIGPGVVNTTGPRMAHVLATTMAHRCTISQPSDGL
ncbi:hypothetical protein PR048_019397 [Dryococelus australis]|uniref:Uncharacterized protein n=1 Tax=Dryococelus australis TaxID=614101 RepID=A0ABQ9H3Q3_9NEOP|nr:hypothetical protein PR048_019397 [Dryococelus australis]